MITNQSAATSRGAAPPRASSDGFELPQVRAAFFDVDETLIVVKSMFTFLRFYLRERGEGPGTYDRLADELGRAAADGVPRVEMNRRYYRFYAGEPAARLAAAGRRWFEQGLTEGFWIPETVVALRRHQQQGAETGLVSGSFFACLDPIAEYLGATWVDGSEPVVEAGTLTGEVRAPMIGAEKAAALGRRARRHELDLARCAAYGDHASDLPMLERVGLPVVVGGNPALVDAATERGWSRLAPLETLEQSVAQGR